MKRFKFSLESVYFVRQKTLDDEQRKLASILNIYNNQTEKLNETISQLNVFKNQCEEYMQGSNFDPMTISNYSMYAKKMQEDIALQKTIVQKTKEVLDSQQTKVKQAYINVKSLENLKDRQKEQYFKEFQAEEIKELDDIVNSRRNIA